MDIRFFKGSDYVVRIREINKGRYDFIVLSKFFHRIESRDKNLTLERAYALSLLWVTSSYRTFGCDGIFDGVRFW